MHKYLLFCVVIILISFQYKYRFFLPLNLTAVWPINIKNRLSIAIIVTMESSWLTYLISTHIVMLLNMYV